MSTTPHSLAAYLTELRKRSGSSLAKIARDAGYAGASSIQRYFDDKDILIISNDVARKLAKALYGRGDPPIKLEDLSPLLHGLTKDKNVVALETIAVLLGLDINPEIETEYELLASRPKGIPVMGAAYAASWLENGSAKNEPEDWILAPTQRVGDYYAQYALRIIGPSINRVAKDGSYAICEQFPQASHLAQDGKFVHVQRERGDLKEWTVKKVKWIDEAPYLLPDSDHPDHQKAISMEDPEEKISIIGNVVGWYQPA